jgi:hypothetical protein
MGAVSQGGGMQPSGKGGTGAGPNRGGGSMFSPSSGKDVGKTLLGGLAAPGSKGGTGTPNPQLQQLQQWTMQSPLDRGKHPTSMIGNPRSGRL